MSKKYETAKFGYFKHEVILENLDDVVVHDIDLDQFKEMLFNILTIRGNVTPEVANKLLDEEGLNRLKMAFTSPSMLEEISYEYFEMIGDLTINKSIGWYLARRFPEIQQDKQAAMIFTELKKKYISKKLLGPFSKTLGFDKFIRWKEIKYVVSSLGKDDSTQKLQEEQVYVKTFMITGSDLEDVFEAFFACLEDLIDNRIAICAGYSVVYNIIASLFDEIYISSDINKLVDKKSQLKEIMDRRVGFKDKGPIYTYQEAENRKWIVTLELIFNNHPDRSYRGTTPVSVKFVSEPSNIRAEGESKTAEQALKWFEQYGVKWSR